VSVTIDLKHCNFSLYGDYEHCGVHAVESVVPCFRGTGAAFLVSYRNSLPHVVKHTSAVC